MKFFLIIIFLTSFPLISANAYEVKHCSVKPLLTKGQTLSDGQTSLYLSLRYSANVVNDSNNCVTGASIVVRVENANILNHSFEDTISACPGGSASTKSNSVHLIGLNGILLENYDYELQFVHKEYEEVKKAITNNKLICHWYPK